MSETTGRVLQLLGLLQARRVWRGDELAERLGVTTRSVRRDVDRLRELGYPVHASTGLGGGYRLGAGAALPPLLLDPDEAVAMAVCLRVAAGGSVAGVGESALRALSKLDQVMPARLRSQVAAVHQTHGDPGRRHRDPGRARRADDARPGQSRPRTRHRRLRRPARQRHPPAASSPTSLVTTGRRWYLLCYDRDRADWRSLRLDRMSDVRAHGTTFTPRDAPDAASYVRRAISSSPYPYVARVRYAAPQDVVAQVFSTASVDIEPDGPDACILTTGADDPQRMVPWLAMPGCDFEVLEPPEVIDAVRTVAERIARAAR